MPEVKLPVQFAPDTFSQSILPNWGFSLFNINLGSSRNPEVELDMLREIGSYGRQLGHLAEALEVVIEKLNVLDMDTLTTDQRQALKTFMCDASRAKQIKK